jgi:hypothetical protein
MVSFSAGQEAARHLLEGPQRYTCLAGVTRSGKTFLIVRMIMMRALQAKGSRHAILRHHANAAWASIALGTLPQVVQVCFPGVRLKEHRQDGYFALPNDSRVWIGGLDDDDRVEKILGLEYASVFLNEASQIPYSTALIAFTRLAQVTRGIRQHAFVDLNPAGKSHWTNVLFGEQRDPVSMQPLKDPENYRRAFLNPPDNTENLSAEFLASLENLPEKQRKRFYEGVYVDEVDGALWTYETIDSGRRAPEDIPDEKRAAVVVALDPSGAAGRDDLGADEIGIVVAARGFDGDCYVLADLSCREAPAVWGRRAVVAFHEFRADCIVAESNFGRRDGSRDHTGGGPKCAGAPCDRKPRQGGSRRADLGTVRARPSASRRPVRQARGPALRLFLGGLHGQQQSRSCGRRDMGAHASFRGR